MYKQESISKLAQIQADLEKSNSRLKELKSNLVKPVNSIPLVSICIPTYNGEDYIAEALSSALLQTYSNIEIIISDDNSNDNTVQITQDTIQNESRIECRLIHHERYGIANNWNFCISQSRGKYIKFLLQDDLLEPNCIEEMVNLAEQQEAIGLVFSKRGLLLASEDNLKDSKILQIYQDAQDLHKDWSNLKSVQTGQDLLADIDILNGSIKRIGEPTTVLLKKEVFNQLGFFDSAFSQALDIEMWLRIMTSYKIGFVNKKLSHWRIHPQQQTYKNVAIGDSLFLGDLLHLCYKIYDSNLYPSQLREQAFQKYKSLNENYPNLTKHHKIDNLAQPVNQAFLSKEREFWNVNSLYEAMFSRVFTSPEIDKMTLQEKIAAWEDSQNTSVKQILEGIPSQSEWKILEIGCGVGRIIKPLRQMFAQVDGVDIAENMIQFAKKYLADGKQNGEVYVNNGCDLQALSSENYDFVYSTIVFQHIRSLSVVKNYFREIFRVLKPAGYFKIQVHDYQDNPAAGKFDEEADTETQYNFFGNGYTEQQLAGLLTEQGFEVIFIESQNHWIWATVQRPEQNISFRDDLIKSQAAQAAFKVSAIVSTYNSEIFIDGCLQDLVEQTLYRKGELEIIVIDCNSEQNEADIVQEYQAQYPNIVYKRISERLTLYAAWNLGIQTARGQYITSANTDDRHHPEALEVMANYFEEHPKTALVYADQLITRVANDTWATTIAAERWNWPQFSYTELERRCVIGSQPMWRKSLHQKYGYFRSEFVCAGDYEFWLRIGKTESFTRLPEVLGLYYVNLQGLEHGSGVAKPETDRVWDEYGIIQRDVTPVSSVPVAVSSSELNQLKIKQFLPSKLSVPQPQKPLVSIIIPTKDRPEMLEIAIQSVLDQTYQNTEIIVINDGGVDVEEVLNRLNYRGNISYVKQDYPRERSAARNAGLRIATGKYIGYLDDDDLYYPHHIQTLVDFLENSQYKVAYTDATKAEQEKQGGKYVTTNRTVPYSYDFEQDSLMVNNYIPILCLMHEKYCLEEVGVFDETLDTHEDWDLWIRISLKFKIFHINKTTCEFTWRTDGSTTTSRRWDDFERTRQIVRNRYSGYAQINSVVQRIAESPFVSVIIPTKDRPEMLEIAVKSVLNQTHENLQIIVINDGGVDIQTRLDKLNSESNITYLNHSQNQERSAARNTGIRAARGEYIAYLDDDDMYYPNHIQTLVEFLKNSDYKVAYSDAVMAEQQKQNGQYVTINRSVPYSLDFDYNKILVGNFIPMLCLMHEKSCLDETGLFDVNLNTHEDWDLLIRLSRSFKIAHINQTTCEFTRRDDSTTTTSKNRADFVRTREIIYNKYSQYAQDNLAVIEAQHLAFTSEAKEVATQLEIIQEKLIQSQSQLQASQLEKQQLESESEHRRQMAQQAQAKLELVQEEKNQIEAQSRAWKYTAKQMQLELEHLRSQLKQAELHLERVQ
ncbi:MULTISPECIES: glycosyltransferase [unclassified Microcoleus]|nr:MULTISPECIES: glycosyltransferase [unclassified Microcoleus]MCC3411328.1 glycosyltransferase [Microcoleus sp. PH2017_02_FOX_O_A]MCC3490878.1 glycosyltransferase [Microcoleus sp. PH2017_16_JOR_D_A]MCC3534465.1 glycosyltransferase [Microcoleus sp. PH2017_25_DOB_D_A]MCC3578035.1 glycosyltransferase [Microcoleus sp. PH2017_32_RDM_D_A]MCC3517358.1 glycosyltransferase [Microcoleus sp. PH2017_18_LLB_O_A]